MKSRLRFSSLESTSYFEETLDIPRREDEYNFFEQIMEVANHIGHSGDYGHVYWNPKTKTIWWVMADSDGGPESGFDTPDMIREKFMSVNGVKDVVTEDESSPPRDDPDWISVDTIEVPVAEVVSRLKFGTVEETPESMFGVPGGTVQPAEKPVVPWTKTQAPKPEWQEYFNYLDDKRHKGPVSLKDGVTDLEDWFGLFFDDAVEVVQAWHKKWNEAQLR